MLLVLWQGHSWQTLPSFAPCTPTSPPDPQPAFRPGVTGRVLCFEGKDSNWRAKSKIWEKWLTLYYKWLRESDSCKGPKRQTRDMRGRADAGRCLPVFGGNSAIWRRTVMGRTDLRRKSDIKKLFRVSRWTRSREPLTPCHQQNINQHLCPMTALLGREGRTEGTKDGAPRARGVSAVAWAPGWAATFMGKQPPLSGVCGSLTKRGSQVAQGLFSVTCACLSCRGSGKKQTC